MGDKITGQCPNHLMPNPATGAPQPSPPLPFSAPLTMGTVATVLIGGKPAAVAGSSGLNVPPHVGLHRGQAGGDVAVGLHLLRHAGEPGPDGDDGADRVRRGG